MAYLNSSGWDDSGAHIHVSLGQGDTYRHNGIEYAHDGLPIHNSRDEYSAPRPQRETRASNTSRPSQPAAHPRAESQANRRTLRDFYEENPPPPRPRYTEGDELREYYATRNAHDRPNTSGNRGQQNGLSAFEYPRDSYLENNRRIAPPPASRSNLGAPSGLYRYYLNDNGYHNTAHLNGSIARARELFSPTELIQYREYDEDYYAGRRRSPIHGGEGYYGDNLRHERYIAGGPHYEAINPRRQQPFSNPILPLRSYHSALDRPSPLQIAEAQGRWAHRDPLYGPSPLEVAEAEGRFAHCDSLGRRSDGRYDDGDPCPNPSAHTGRHGICFARKDAGYPG